MLIVGDRKSSKTEKSSPPAPQDQTNVHACPDWEAMQAYYGGRVPLPPYYNSAVAAGHAPHPYMWGSTPILQNHMMPPYGPPYGAIYLHKGVYTHPVVPLAETALSIETPAKSSGSTDQKKKSKGLDGMEMSIGNGSVRSKEEATDHDPSQSAETEVSSGGSDGNMKGKGQTPRKRSLEGIHTAEKHRKAVAPAKAAAAMETNPASGAISPSSGAVKKVESVLSPSMGTPLELMSPSSMNTKTSSGGALQTRAMLLSDGWGQNKSDLKRERRKQSNRESARRSRLRKQAEAEELAVKVESLNAENLTLKSEVHQLIENSNKLKLENVLLMEKLKLVRQGPTEGMLSNKAKAKSKNTKIQPLSTKNLLSRVNNSSSVLVSHEDEEKIYETKSTSNKLRQLMDTNPMANAVAAG